MQHSGWVVKLIQACIAHSEGKVRCGDMRERMGWCPHRPVPLYLKKQRTLLQPPQEKIRCSTEERGLKTHGCLFKP